MSEAYEEILDSETRIRKAPGARHEEICRRLHARVSQSLTDTSAARLLPQRTMVTLAHGVEVRPDLALVTKATNKLWLAAEVVSSDDHHPDTVIKKTIYEDNGLPRLWMVDPRYDNVEVYHGGQYGLALKEILAVRETLKESLLPAFEYIIADLFKI